MRGGLMFPLGEHGGTLFRGLIPRWFLFLFLLMGAAIGVEFIPAIRAFFHDWPIMTIGTIASFVGLYLWYMVAARRVVRSEYRVCLKCRGALPGGKDWGVCPTCSHYFNIPEIKGEFESPFSLSGPAGLPGAARRSRRIGALGGAMLACGALLGILPIPSPWFEWLFIGFMGGGACLIATAFILERRLLARVKRAAYRVCPDCEYSLAGVGYKGTCPECGRAFDEDSVRHDWQRCFRRWERY